MKDRLAWLRITLRGFAVVAGIGLFGSGLVQAASRNAPDAGLSLAALLLCSLGVSVAFAGFGFRRSAAALGAAVTVAALLALGSRHGVSAGLVPKPLWLDAVLLWASAGLALASWGFTGGKHRLVAASVFTAFTAFVAAIMWRFPAVFVSVEDPTAWTGPLGAGLALLLFSAAMVLLIALAAGEGGSHRLAFPVAVAVACVAGTVSLWVGERLRDRDHLNSALEFVAGSATQGVQSALSQRLVSVERLAKRWSASPFSADSWKTDAGLLLDDFPDMSGLAWIRSNGHVRAVALKDGVSQDAFVKDALPLPIDPGAVPPFSPRLFTTNADSPTALAFVAMPDGLGSLLAVFGLRSAIADRIPADLGYEASVSADRIELSAPNRSSLATPSERRFVIGERPWRLSVQSVPADESLSILPSITLFTGTLVSLLLGLALSLGHSARRRAEELERSNLELENEVARRAAVERTLGETSDLLQAIVDGIGDGVLVTDKKGSVILVNPAAARLFGISLAGQAFDVWTSEIVFQDGDRGEPIDRERHPVTRALAAQVLNDWETKVRLPDEPSPRWLEVSARPLADRNNDVIGSVLAFRDITTRKEQEAELKRSQRRLNDAEAMAHVGSWEWDVRPDAVYLSDEMLRILGLEPSGAPVRLDALLERVHPDDRAVFRKTLDGIATGRGRFELEHRVVRPSGEGRVVLTRGEAVSQVGRSGAIIHGSAQDVTDWRRDQQALRTSESRLQAMLRNSPSVVYLKDRDGRYLLANRRFEEMTGVSETDVTGKTDRDFFQAGEAEAMRENDLKVLFSGQPIECEERLRLPGGERVFLSTKFPIRDESGEVFATGGIATDITIRVRAEEALREKTRLIQLLQSSTVAIHGAGGIAEALRAVLERVCVHAGAAAGHALQVDEKDGGLRSTGLWYFTGAPRDGAEHPARSAITGSLLPSLAERAVAERRAVWSADGASPALFESATAVVACPVNVQDHPAVLLEFALPRSHVTDGVVDVMNQIGLQLGRFIAHRRSEEEMHQLADIVASSDDAIIGQSLDGAITSWNTGAERIYGYAASEAVGQPISFLFPPDRKQELEYITDRIARGEPVVHHETLRLRKSGEPISVAVTISPIRNSRNEIVGASTVARDITARVQAEQALRESKALFDSFMNHTPALAFMKDEEGRYLYINKTFEDLEKTTGEQMGGKTDFDWLPDHIANQVQAKDRAVLDSGQSSETVEEIPLADGTIRHWLVLRFPLQSAAGKHLLGVVCVDISARREAEEAVRRAQAELEIRVLERTQELGSAIAKMQGEIMERKRMEKELARRADELASSNRELEQFAFVASHDLQEPLRKIASYGELLSQRYRGKMDEKADKFIGYMVDGVRRMQDLIKDLLAYSRVGKADVTFQSTDLNDVMKRTLADLEATIQENAAAVNVSPLPVVNANASQMGQLFQNLITNALKFRSESSPRILIFAESKSTEWELSVKDNGIGIDPEHKDRIFQIFQRLHSRDRFPGTGIGLAICKKIVERHGGRIWVSSKPGEGATFHFTLPVLATHENAVSSGGSAA